MLLLLVGMACLFPASLYCLFLAMLHQRRRPTIISGPWDAAGVLLALSGFLLIGGSILVFTLHGTAREWLVHGRHWHDIRAAHSRETWLTWAAWGGYFALLAGGSVALMCLRRNVTALYNLAPEELDDVLQGTLDRLGQPWSRRGDTWLIGPPDRLHASIKIDGSAALRYVSLHWAYSATPAVRAELSAELARDLAAPSYPESSASSWFLTAAGALFTAMIFLLGSFLLIVYKS